MSHLFRMPWTVVSTVAAIALLSACNKTQPTTAPPPASDKPAAALRVGVRNGGCAGMSYTMEYAEAVNPHDEVVEDRGVRLLIDPKAVLFLLGTEMDYRADKMQAQFVFNNPNQISACGCGESVQLRPAEV